MKSFYCKALIILVIVFSTPVFAQNCEKPDVHVGDRWSWQHTDALSNEPNYTQIEDVVGVSDKEISIRVRMKGKPGQSGIATYTPEWNQIDVISAKYTPYLKEFAFPLEVGKKWDASANKTVFRGGSYGKFLVKGEVVAIEKVTVPAGTFDAYRIKVDVRATGTDENAQLGNTTETYWYAPDVKRYVKRELTFEENGRIRNKDIFELVEYSLR